MYIRLSDKPWPFSNNKWLSSSASNSSSNNFNNRDSSRLSHRIETVSSVATTGTKSWGKVTLETRTWEMEKQQSHQRRMRRTSLCLGSQVNRTLISNREKNFLDKELWGFSIYTNDYQVIDPLIIHVQHFDNSSIYTFNLTSYLCSLMIIPSHASWLSSSYQKVLTQSFKHLFTLNIQD